MESPASQRRRIFDPARRPFRASASTSPGVSAREAEALAECADLRAENAVLETRMQAMLSVCTAADETLTANAAQLREAEEERKELELALTSSASRIAALEARARSSASAVVQLREERRLAEARYRTQAVEVVFALKRLGEDLTGEEKALFIAPPSSSRVRQTTLPVAFSSLQKAPPACT